MINQHSDELFPLVDDNGVVIGSATRAECHSGSKLLHPVVHLHLMNSKGEIYLQHRPAWKDIQPNKWDSGVGGHVDFGEKVVDALMRESREELGIEGFEPKFVCSYIFESEVEREMVNVFTTVFDGEVSPTEELDGGRFWMKSEIFESLGKGVFTPNFESELRTVLIPKGVVNLASLYNFREATIDDLDTIMLFIAESQELLRTRGVDQWQDGYPTSEVIINDIEKSQGYILECGSEIAAYGAIISGADPNYKTILNGTWLSQNEYITMHRLSVNSKFRGAGVGAEFFHAMEREAVKRNICSLRADTHRDNVVMRRLLTRIGFEQCGDVYIRGAHRYGFEKLL